MSVIITIKTFGFMLIIIIFMPCLGKKNVQNMRSRLHMYYVLYNMRFVDIQLDNFYDYMKLVLNNVICILDYQFLNLIR